MASRQSIRFPELVVRPDWSGPELFRPQLGKGQQSLVFYFRQSGGRFIHCRGLLTRQQRRRNGFPPDPTLRRGMPAGIGPELVRPQLGKGLVTIYPRGEKDVGLGRPSAGLWGVDVRA